MTPDLPMLVVGLALVFAAGVGVGWHLARNVTGYMLMTRPGRPTGGRR